MKQLIKAIALLIPTNDPKGKFGRAAIVWINAKTVAAVSEHQ